MKKLVFVLGLGVFAACGGGAASDAAKDSVKTDSGAAMMSADTTKKDSTPVAIDTTKKVDSTKKK